MKKPLLCVFGSIILANSVHAATIVGVDVVGALYTGGGVLDTTSRQWTSGPSGANIGLDTGSFTLTYSGFAGSGSFGSPAISLFQDYWHSGSPVLTFTGLDNSKQYNFVLYSATANGAGQGAKFTLASGTYGGAATRSSAGAAGSSFVENQNYVRFDNVSTNGSGQISFNLTTNVSTSILNGFEIAVVPEPGAFSALLGGTGVLLGLRRRRSA